MQRANAPVPKRPIAELRGWAGSVWHLLTTYRMH